MQERVVGLSRDAIHFFTVETWDDHSMDDRAFFLRYEGAPVKYKRAMQIYHDTSIERGGVKHRLCEWFTILPLLQQSFEQYLKALLLKKGVDNWGHDLIFFFEKVLEIYPKDLYPELHILKECQESFFLLEDLGEHFNKIRYVQGCIMFRHSKDTSDYSFTEFEKTLEAIKNAFEQAYDKNV